MIMKILYSTKSKLFYLFLTRLFRLILFYIIILQTLMTALELRAGITAVVLMELINLLVIVSQDLEESTVREVCFS